MNSWSTKTGCSWYHLELNPSHYGQWSEMLTVECKLESLMVTIYHLIWIALILAI